MSDGGEPRFEFRVWGERLDPVTGRLRSLSECHEVRESAEIYFVSTMADDVNPKARAELLDIKVLVGVRDGFEQWDVHRKAEFPVSAALLRSELFPLLGVAAPLLDRNDYSLTQLIDAVASHPDVTAVEVTKRRQMYTVNECIAEITDATIGGRQRQTVAVESGDLDALTDARRMLGLDGYDNVSYPRAIRGTLGERFAVD